MKTLEERFWEKVNRTGECWLWTGAKNDRGYGYFKAAGRNAKAHRVSYQISKGAIPDGINIDHICHNTSCVRPDHLRLATQKQNLENLTGAHSTNVTSGVRGVYRSREGRWQARVTHNRTIHTAGTHATIQQAEAAVIALRNQLFTHNDADRQQQRAS